MCFLDILILNPKRDFFKKLLFAEHKNQISWKEFWDGSPWKLSDVLNCSFLILLYIGIRQTYLFLRFLEKRNCVRQATYKTLIRVSKHSRVTLLLLFFFIPPICFITFLYFNWNLEQTTSSSSSLIIKGVSIRTEIL